MNFILTFIRCLKIFGRTLFYLKQVRQKPQQLESLKQQWASELIQKFNMNVQVIGSPVCDPSILYIGNHISYVDIPLLMRCVPQLSFVSKKEVASWPIIGEGAKQAGTVFVDRQSKFSRNTVSETVLNALKAGRRIALFPAGTTTEHETVPWKSGAFKIAQRGGFKIQPFRIDYAPLRKVAYIDDDTLLFHLMTLLKKDPIQVKIEFHEPVYVEDIFKDLAYWQSWTQDKQFKIRAQQEQFAPKPETMITID